MVGCSTVTFQLGALLSVFIGWPSVEMASRIMLSTVPTYSGIAILRCRTKTLLRKESALWNSTPDVWAVEQKHM